jgi:hypothetical protein
MTIPQNTNPRSKLRRMLERALTFLKQIAKQFALEFCPYGYGIAAIFLLSIHSPQ